MLAEVRAAITAGHRLWLGRVVQAGTTTPAQAVAALLAAGVQVIRAPQDLLTAAAGWTNGGPA